MSHAFRRIASSTLAVVALPLLLVIATADCRVESAATSAPRPGSIRDQYVGSHACAHCHAKEYGLWKASLHSRMEQAAAPDTVISAFTTEGTVVKTEADGKRIVLRRDGDAFIIEAPNASGAQQEFAIERTVGNRYKQRYLTRFADGSWHALPVQWFAHDGKFVEWRRQASEAPGTGNFWMDDAWQWQLKCAGCHTTGLDLNYDAEKKSYVTEWRELAIGCEACHGPGVAHVRAQGGTDNILCPSEFTHAQQLDTCGKCHSRGTAGPDQGAPAGLPGKLAYPYDLMPGDALDAHFVQATPENSPPTDFWKDGSSRNHHQQLTDYRRSEMFHHGEDAPTCTTCHDAHDAAALVRPIEDNSLCTQCHEDLGGPKELAEHSGHGGDPLANAGARCVECHMPRIVDHAGSYKLRSHTYWSPNPERALATGTPDACLLCHADKDAAWSSASAAKFWPKSKDEKR
ncbi:MAG: hypothetical protein K8S98_04910 [Planctomycetes bacterium]|nr:hypothetical protein [Planctomycetota bacterium]